MWLLEKFQINYSLLPIKLFYLFYYGGVSCVTPFLPHYLQQNKGFSAVDVTTILGIVPFIVIATKPIVGHIADTTKCFRLLLAGVLIIGGIFMCLISLVPGIKIFDPSLGKTKAEAFSQEPLNFTIMETNDTEVALEEIVFYASREDIENVSLELEADISIQDPYSATHFCHPTFWLVFACIIVGKAFGLSTAYPLMDALTLGVLGRNSTKQYGRQRMWMAVGLATALLTVSLCMDAVKESSSDLVDYRPAFIGFAFCLSISIICVFFVPLPEQGLQNENDLTVCSRGACLKSQCCHHQEVESLQSETNSNSSGFSEDSNVRQGSGGLRKLLPSLKQTHVVLFLLMAFVCGMNFGTAVWMSPFYLKVDLVASQTSIGLVVVFYCVCTMVSFMLSGHIVQFVGHELSLAICLISYSVRALLWSAVTQPWHTLPCEILFGLSVGLWLPTMGSYAKNLAGPDCRASAQSVLSAVFDGFGVGVGNLLSGRIYQDLGGRSAWRLLSLFTGLCSFLYILCIACSTDVCTPAISNKKCSPAATKFASRKDDIREAKRIILDLQKIDKDTTVV